MHYQHSIHPIADIGLAVYGLCMINLHSLVTNTAISDIFTLMGWFAIIVGSIRSGLWLYYRWRNRHNKYPKR